MLTFKYIFGSPTGLISIAGGKLTGYRKMAERVVNLVIKTHFPGRALKGCHTDTIRLPGSDFRNVKEVARYIAHVASLLSAHGLGQLSARYLVENYGRQTDQILAFLAASDRGEPGDLKLLKAEFQFSFRHEMVVSMQDFFVRRTGLLYFDIPKVIRWKNDMAFLFKDVMGWDEMRFRFELQALDELIRDITGFRKAAPNAASGFPCRYALRKNHIPGGADNFGNEFPHVRRRVFL